MDEMVRKVFQFEGFALDATRRLLRTGDNDVDLRPKGFDVLCCLVENAGRVVTKDELIAKVWPDVIASDESLARCISDARLALGDNDHRLIKTVPRKGYLFAAPVSQVPLDASWAPIETGPAGLAAIDPGSGHRFRRALAACWTRLRSVRGRALALGGLLLLAAGTGIWASREPGVLTLPDRPSIAVLPFANSSGDPEQDYFSDGISEDLTTSLSKFSDLFVIAWGSAATYKGKHLDVKRIGRELGVRYLLQGSVRRDAEGLRITARLVDAGTAEQIWAESYDPEPRDIFAVQDEVTKNIVVTLVAHVTRSEVERVRRKPPEKFAAYDYYLRGNAALKRAHGGKHGEAIAKARAFYEQAIAADPRYAPAFEALAKSYLSAWLDAAPYEPIAREYRQKSTLDRALQLAEKAVELDGTLAEAHATRAYVLRWQDRQSEAMAEWQRAFEVNPNLVDGRYARTLGDAGHRSEAVAYLNRIMRLDPFHPPFYFCYLGHSYYMAGRYAEALEALRRLPSSVTALAWRVAAATEWGRNEEARSAAADILRLDPKFSITTWLQVERPPEEISERLSDSLRTAGLPD